jgi:hypothetical protein
MTICGYFGKAQRGRIIYKIIYNGFEAREKWAVKY